MLKGFWRETMHFEKCNDHLTINLNIKRCHIFNTECCHSIKLHKFSWRIQNIGISLSQFDFLSHDDTYYIPPLGKPTCNPEHQVMSERTETSENNNLHKDNKLETNQNKYIFRISSQNLKVTSTKLSIKRTSLKSGPQKVSQKQQD